MTEPPPVVSGSDVTVEELEKRRLQEKRKKRFRDVHAIYFMPAFESSEPAPPAGASMDDLRDYMKRMTAERRRVYYERQEIERLKEAPLAESQQREFNKRLAIRAAEMKKYFKNNRLDKKSFKSDIESGRYSVYVFSFGYAKLESCRYKNFIKSLNNANFGKVYFARNTALSRIVGLVSEAEFDPELKLGDRGYRGTKELLPGLHKIGSLLDADDVGVLLTTQTKDVVLSKLREYRECDFVKPGQRPMEPLAYGKDDVIPLPPRSSAMKLCTKLKELGMPVELSGGGEIIKLTDNYSVCKDGERVTVNATEILKLLDIRMFSYVLVPLGFWSASTKVFESIPLDIPKSR